VREKITCAPKRSGLTQSGGTSVKSAAPAFTQKQIVAALANRLDVL